MKEDVTEYKLPLWRAIAKENIKRITTKTLNILDSQWL